MAAKLLMSKDLLEGAVVAAEESKAHEFRTQSITNLFWSVARLQWRSDDPFLTAISSAAQRLCAEFNR